MPYFKKCHSACPLPTAIDLMDTVIKATLPSSVMYPLLDISLDRASINATALDTDVLRLVMETAALADPGVVVVLSLVSKMVRLWTEPILYHTITLSGSIFNGFLRKVQSFAKCIAARRSRTAFFHAHVKHLLLHIEELEDEDIPPSINRCIALVLQSCTGLHSLRITVTGCPDWVCTPDFQFPDFTSEHTQLQTFCTNLASLAAMPKIPSLTRLVLRIDVDSDRTRCMSRNEWVHVFRQTRRLKLITFHFSTTVQITEVPSTWNELQPLFQEGCILPRDVMIILRLPAGISEAAARYLWNHPEWHRRIVIAPWGTTNETRALWELGQKERPKGVYLEPIGEADAMYAWEPPSDRLWDRILSWRDA